MFPIIDMASTKSSGSPPGQIVFAIAYSTTPWTVPAGVYSISMVCVAGGHSNFPISSVTVSSVVVCSATNNTWTVGDGGGNGGGGNIGYYNVDQDCSNGGPGGGAGGYSGNGGNAHAAGSGGGGGGGGVAYGEWFNMVAYNGGNGGGVGLLGAGANGIAGAPGTYGNPGGPGSGGSGQSYGGGYGSGGAYYTGGALTYGQNGGGLAYKNNVAVTPGQVLTIVVGYGNGAVRIMWGGGRSYPNNAGDL